MVKMPNLWIITLILLGQAIPVKAQSVDDYERAARAKVQARKAAEAKAIAEQRAAEARIIEEQRAAEARAAAEQRVKRDAALKVKRYAALEAKRIAEEITSLEQKANSGDAQAALTLADRYWNGQGVERSMALAARWYKIAADQGASGALLRYSEIISIAVTKPLPTGNPGTWVTVEDYPRKALTEERQGVVYFKLNVGIDGLPKSCEIKKSSGHADLDAKTCELLMTRSKFQPALNVYTKPIIGEYSSFVIFSLPE